MSYEEIWIPETSSSSDDCKFSLFGKLKERNYRICGSERAQQVHEAAHNSFLLTVWCALSEREIIVPYLFENRNVTGQSYKRMFRYYVFPRLRNYAEDKTIHRNGAFFTMPLIYGSTESKSF